MILITGCAGFIGFHLSRRLLEKKVKIIGVDNIDKYYSTKLKQKRISIPKKSKDLILLKLI